MSILKSKYFSIIELLIVIGVMLILSLMIFVVIKGAKDSARTVMTDSTLKTVKVNVEHLTNYIVGESRKKNIELNQHPLFTEIWPSNKVWTFRDVTMLKDGINSNGLTDMMTKGALGTDTSSIVIQKVEYPGYTDAIDTLVDGWGAPILLMRNELAWWVKNKDPNDSVSKIYRDRTKSNVGLYSYNMFSTSTKGLNLYSWNDVSFDHKDSKGVTESSYEIAPPSNNGYRILGKEMYGQQALPYNTNDFDFLSAGKDGKIGNLIPSDLRQDRWLRKEQVDKKDITSPYKAEWVNASTLNYDPDNDNIITYNRYSLE